MPPITPAQVLQCFAGASSSASTPVACGTPKGDPHEVFIGTMGVGKVGDRVDIPSASDQGPVTKGHPTVEVMGCPLAKLGDPVKGDKGTPAFIDKPATAADRKVFTGDSGAVKPAPFLPSDEGSEADDVIGSLIDAAGNLPGPMRLTKIGKGLKVVDGLADADGVVSAGQSDGLLSAANELGKSTAQGAAAGAAMSAAQPGCLSAAVGVGMSVNVALGPANALGYPALLGPAAAGATWLTCTLGIGTAASYVTGEVWDAAGDKLKENAKKQAMAARSRAAYAQGRAALQGRSFGGFMGF